MVLKLNYKKIKIHAKIDHKKYAGIASITSFITYITYIPYCDACYKQICQKVINIHIMLFNNCTIVKHSSISIRYQQYHWIGV